MIHDREILDRLSAITPITFDGEVHRATRKHLHPLTFSTSGGRWSLKGGVATLYTSLERDGALAEIAFHWGQLSPLPSKPASLHRIRVKARQTLRLLQADLGSLGVSADLYQEVNYQRTQQIGAAVAFLECDGLLAPSARWSCENLILFNEIHHPEDALEIIATEEVDWLSWARSHGLLDSDNESGFKRTSNASAISHPTSCASSPAGRSMAAELSEGRFYLPDNRAALPRPREAS